MIKSLIHLLRSLGYQINYRPYELNLLGLRADSSIPNRFDDLFICFYRDGAGKWILYQWNCTTDPGTYYLNNPLMPEGTAILAQGQHQFKLGYHRNSYEALVQAAPITVIRDYNRNGILDFASARLMTGWFGINIHRASSSRISTEVNRWSAGCQVIPDPDQFALLIQLCKYHRQLYGNQFLYSLVDERQFHRNKRTKKILAIGGFAMITAAVSGALIFKNNT